MRKYTYINPKTGKRTYSDTPLSDPSLKLVTAIRGSVPRSVEKKPLSAKDQRNLEIAVDGKIL